MVKKLKSRPDPVVGPDGESGVNGEPCLRGNRRHHKEAMAFWRGHPAFTGNPEDPGPGDWMYAYHELLALLTRREGAEAQKIRSKASTALLMAATMRGRKP